jgi:hypothetical protein
MTNMQFRQAGKAISTYLQQKDRPLAVFQEQKMVEYLRPYAHFAAALTGVHPKSLPSAVAPEKPRDTVFAAALACLKHSARAARAGSEVARNGTSRAIAKSFRIGPA